MIFLRYINHIKSYFFAELNEDNFYMKIIDLDEIYNFLVLIFFHLKSLRCSKKLMSYLDLRIFSTFHTCSLIALEPKLTAVVWRTQKSWNSDAEDRWTFPETHRALRYLMAHRKFPIFLISILSHFIGGRGRMDSLTPGTSLGRSASAVPEACCVAVIRRSIA